MRRLLLPALMLVLVLPPVALATPRPLPRSGKGKVTVMPGSYFCTPFFGTPTQCVFVPAGWTQRELHRFHFG